MTVRCGGGRGGHRLIMAGVGGGSRRGLGRLMLALSASSDQTGHQELVAGERLEEPKEDMCGRRAK